MYNFKLANLDTDSIMIVKQDQEDFSKEERKTLLKELNDLSPNGLVWADDGYYETVIILRAKNYILKKAGEKPKYKGSAIKATLKEARLRQFILDIIKEIGLDRHNYVETYNGYVREIMNITDISGWVVKKTITDKVLTGERANETKVKDVIAGTDYRESDKIYCFYLPNKELALRESFTGVYCKNTLLKKLYATAKIFDTVIDVKATFLDYSLKRNKAALLEVLK